MKNLKKTASVQRRRLSLEKLEERQMLAVTYWVDDNDPGSNSGAGDYGTVITNPFVTIQEAAAVAAAGDTVNIREGTYRETVTPTNSGSAADPIIYQAYNGEQVTVSGAETISGFTQLTGDIYQANMPTSLGFGSDQIFVDGQMMLWARWPNTLSLDVSNPVWDTNSTITATAVGGDWDVSLTDTSFPGDASDWAGGYVRMAPANGWINETGLIRASSSGDTLDFDFLTFPYEPQSNDEYYLTGTFQALDSAGEWFRDSGGTLSLWQPGGGDPDTSNVEYKARDYAFELGGIDYTTLDGIDIFASTIRMDATSDYNTIQNMDAKYLSHLELIETSGWGVGTFDTGIILYGSNNTLRDSTIAYSSGNGVSVRGDGQRIINNTIRDVNYLGTDAAAIYTENSFASPTTNLEFAYNTVYNTGRSGIVVRYAQGSRIHHNEIYNAMLQTSDGGAISTFGIEGGPDFNDGKGSVIAYNRIYDIYAFGDPGDSRVSAGIYLDNGSNGYTVNDNIVWNTQRALQLNTFTVDQDHKIYNNTLVGDDYALESFGKIGEQNTTGTEFWNNLLVGTVDFYNAGWNSNGSNYVTANVATVQFVNPAGADYRLSAGSPAIDVGTATPPYTRGALGAAPDAGAIEFNTPAFTAGVGSNRDLDGNAIDVGSGTTTVNAGYYDTLGPSPTANLDSLITGVTIEDVSSEFGTRVATQTIDQSGMTGAGVFGAGTHDTSANTTMWLSDGSGSGTGVITYDLGANYDLSALKVWNYNETSGGTSFTNRGAQTVTILVSPDDNVSSLVSLGSFTFAEAPGLNTYTGELIDLSSFGLAGDARLVRFDITANYGNPLLVGLSEVQFQGAAVVPGPLVTGVTATASSENPGREIDTTVDGSGLTVTTFGAGLHSTSVVGDMWLTAAGAGVGATATFDLGANYDLDATAVWQYNETADTSRGISTFTISVSPDSNVANLVDLGSTFSLTTNPGLGNIASEILDLSSFALADNARLVRFTVLTTPGSDRAGLSEVQFKAAAVAITSVDLSPGGSYYDSDQTNSAASPIRPNDAVDANGAGVVGGIEEGEWLEYTLDVQAAGTYDLTFNLGTFGAGDSVTASIRDGSGFTTAGSVTTADLVSGNDYRLSNVSLDAGLQVVRIQFGGDGFDFTQFEIEGITLASADFDSDSDIDGFDFLSWQRGFGIQAPNAVKADGDADNDTDVDATDLSVWEAQFGGPAPAVAAPATAAETLATPDPVPLASVVSTEIPVAAAARVTPTSPAPAPVVSVVTTESPVATVERTDAILALAFQTASDLIDTSRSLLEEVDPVSHTALAHDRFLEFFQEERGNLRDRIARDISSFRDQVSTRWASDWSEELDSHQEELAFETALEQIFGA